MEEYGQSLGDIFRRPVGVATLGTAPISLPLRPRRLPFPTKVSELSSSTQLFSNMLVAKGYLRPALQDEDEDKTPPRIAMVEMPPRKRHKKSVGVPAFRSSAPNWICCSKRCILSPSITDAVILAARQVFYQLNCDVVPVASDRQALMSLSRDMLPRVPTGNMGKDKLVCINMMTHVLACSKKFIYASNKPSLRTNSEERRARPCPVFLSIFHWFLAYIPNLDRMPDKSWYQVSAATRKTVYTFYCEDLATRPELNLVKVRVSCSLLFAID